MQLHKTADREDLIVATESSAIGGSQSNGLAERTIQLVEDGVRTSKSAFEERIEARLTSAHHTPFGGFRIYNTNLPADAARQALAKRARHPVSLISF